MHIFFVQLEPDIDHTTPIAYKLVQGNPDSVLMVCTNVLYDIENDYRLQYLRDILNIKVAYIHQVHKGLFFKLRAMKVLLRLPNRILLRLPNRIWNSFYFKVKVMDEKWAASFLQSVKAKSITVDEALPQDSLKVLADTARLLSIPLVVIPTGARMLKIPMSKPPDFLKSAYNIIYPLFPMPSNDLYPRFKVMGCARNCYEWQKINSRLVREGLPGYELPDEEGKLKVLIFSRPDRQFDENHSTIKLIKGLDYVTTIFKAKPRMTKPQKCYEVGFHQYPSVRLIQWADVVICSVSSMVLDIFYYDKIFIYPKYIGPEDVGIFEDYNACWIVESEEELISALKKVYENPNFRPYRADDVNNFCRDVVYGNDRSYDVLGRYAEFYSSLGISR